jgi:hypothetical protein
VLDARRCSCARCAAAAQRAVAAPIAAQPLRRCSLLCERRRPPPRRSRSAAALRTFAGLGLLAAQPKGLHSIFTRTDLRAQRPKGQKAEQSSLLETLRTEQSYLRRTEQSFGEGGAEQVGQGGAEQVGEGGAATGDRRPATVRQTTGDSAATAEVCTLSLGLGLGLGLFTFTRVKILCR